MASVRVILLLWVVSVVPCVAEPSLVGVLTDGAVTHVVIRLNPGDRALWLKVGDAAGEYRITKYDPKRESVLLQGKSEVLELRLPSARIKPLVDLQKAEALASAGNRRLTELLASYRENEKRRARFRALAESRKATVEPSETAKLHQFIQWLKIDGGSEKIIRELSAALASASIQLNANWPNKSPEPTPTAVTPRAKEMETEKKKSNCESNEARGAPAAGVAHL